MKKYIVAISMMMTVGAYATCELVSESGSASAFSGTYEAGTKVEKKSLNKLNSEFPGIRIMEKIFKGEAKSCSNCDGQKHIRCK